jgi:PhzF family phenazine biosynthesis protein
MSVEGGRRYRLFQVDAFTRQRFTGNPAGVVLDAGGLSAGEMQRIARELGNPETAFLLPPDGDDHDLRVRYFTPTVEVPICGHATIAAHFVRALVLDLPSGEVVQRSPAGRLTITVLRDGARLRVRMAQLPPVFGAPLEGATRAALLAALGLREEDLVPGLPIQEVSTGHGKGIVPLRDRDRLFALRPDLAALAALSAETGIHGFHVFTLDAREPGVTTACRMFAPAIGIPEDPVTGNGNGPLGAYLVRHRLVPHDGRELVFVSAQGETMGRKGHARVAVTITDGEPTGVSVGEDAVIVYEAALFV